VKLNRSLEPLKCFI